MYRNSEGYADPTAGAAFAAISRKERREMSETKKAKEYMNQAYRIVHRINAKIEQGVLSTFFGYKGNIDLERHARKRHP